MNRYMVLLCVVALACGDKDPADTASSTDSGDGGDGGGGDGGDGGSGDGGDGGNADACPDGAKVIFTSTTGTVQDLSELFTTGEYLTLGTPGTIEVCPGTWYARLLIRADMTVIGLGDTPADTVLSGGESGTIIDISGPDVSLHVENLSFDRGAGLDVEHASGGGGLYCDQEGVVVVRDARFTNNFANDGSGLYGRNCNIEIHDTVFMDNLSEDDGGAIDMWNSTALISGVTVKDNTALDGGAMALFQSDVTVENSTFSNNSAQNFGGGIWVFDSTLAMSDSTIENSVNTGSDYGGGLIVYGAATLDRVSFTGNSAPQGGGLFVYYEATVEGTDCNFSGNTPEDIFAADYSQAGGVAYTAGSNYSFSCSANTCTGQ